MTCIPCIPTQSNAPTGGQTGRGVNDPIGGGSFMGTTTVADPTRDVRRHVCCDAHDLDGCHHDIAVVDANPAPLATTVHDQVVVVDQLRDDTYVRPVRLSPRQAKAQAVALWRAAALAEQLGGTP